MKRTHFVLLVACVFSLSANSYAGAAEQFIGWYKILSQSKGVKSKVEFLQVDNGTLQELWDRYGSGQMPDNLQPYRNEQTIIAGFTDRDFFILTFEALSLITNTYLRISGNEDLLLELYRRPDGQFDMATREHGRVNRYLLAAPAPGP